MKFSSLFVFAYLIPSICIASPISDNDIQLLRKLISSDQFDVFIIHRAQKRCSKVFLRSADGTSYSSVDGLYQGNIEDHEVTVLARSKIIDEPKSGYRACAPKSGFTRSNYGNGLPDNTDYKLYYELELIERSCSVVATYDNCTTRCVSYHQAGTPLYAFAVTKDVAEQVSGTICTE